MSNSALRALVLSANTSAFGVPATVTRPSPDDTPIETTLIWVTPATDDVPGALPYQRRDPIRVVALVKADVPTAPRGTRIEAAEADGGAVKRWKVDAVERVEVEHVRVIVVPADA